MKFYWNKERYVLRIESGTAWIADRTTEYGYKLSGGKWERVHGRLQKGFTKEMENYVWEQIDANHLTEAVLETDIGNHRHPVSSPPTHQTTATAEEALNALRTALGQMPGKVDEDEIIRKVTAEVLNNLPVKTIRVEMPDKPARDVPGVVHEKFETILKLVKANVPVMLKGSAGSGKNHTLEQVAEALDLDFYISNAVTQEHKLTGFIDAGGKYHTTQFREAFEHGGLFMLDEIDASRPDVLVALNSAIANGKHPFPDKTVQAHPEFRIVCAGNTYGNGANATYVGRNPLDGATLDRFVVIDFEYSKQVEETLTDDSELLSFVWSLRKTVDTRQLKMIVSMRAIINASKMRMAGIPVEHIISGVFLKGISTDDIETLKEAIPYDDNEYARALHTV